ncbi:MAG: hypothetical protein RLZZ69_2763, partial [Cyanobacteriota bacterium]
EIDATYKTNRSGMLQFEFRNLTNSVLVLECP